MGQYIYLANSMTTITDKNIKGYVDAYLNLYKDNKGNTLAFGRQRFITKLPSDLKNIKIGEWDVSNVTDMSGLFMYNMSSMKT
jgi:surface protein